MACYPFSCGGPKRQDSARGYSVLEAVQVALTAVHLVSAMAWLGGMIFHIVVLDPVLRKNEVSMESAFLLALVERRFRKLVGTSIVFLTGSGIAKAWLILGSAPALWTTAAGRTVLFKIGLTAALLVIFAVCPKTKSCSPIPGVCDIAAEGLLRGRRGAIRERSRVILPKVALALGLTALAAAVLLRG